MLDSKSIEFVANSRPASNGAFGEVFLAKYKAVDSKIACDVAVKLPLFRRSGVLDSFLNEIKILKLCQHSNIVKFYGCFNYTDEDSTRIGLVFEWCSHILQGVAAKRVDPVKVGLDICHALNYLHGKRIVHRDIKPSNILICKKEYISWTDAVAKLCDFGSAKVHTAGESDEESISIGTSYFRAPEMRGGLYDHSSDVYCLGKTFEILCQENESLGKNAELNHQWKTLSKGMVKKVAHQRSSLREIIFSLTDCQKVQRGKSIPESSYNELSYNETTDEGLSDSLLLKPFSNTSIQYSSTIPCAVDESSINNHSSSQLLVDIDAKSHLSDFDVDHTKTITHIVEEEALEIEEFICSSEYNQEHNVVAENLVDPVIHCVDLDDSNSTVIDITDIERDFSNISFGDTARNNFSNREKENINRSVENVFQSQLTSASSFFPKKGTYRSRTNVLWTEEETAA
jgi:serine/threonine protein kinase